MNDLKKIERSLMTQDLQIVEDSIESILKLKTDIVNILLNALIEAKDNRIKKLIALSIVDNFRDEKILTTLKELISKDLKNENAILLYALGEYSNSVDLLEFLVELILEKDYHTALNSINIIFSMNPQIDETLTLKLLNKVENFRLFENEKMEIIQDLKLFLKNQLA